VSTVNSALPTPDTLAGLDALLSDEEREIRQVVRTLAQDCILPNVSTWYSNGHLPARQLAIQLGQLGLFGMHLHGYGCAGTSAVAYGLACLELEACDSGIRSLVSVQGSLAMFALHQFGTDDLKQQWLPDMAAGRKIGCFGLTEPDSGSDPAGMRTRATRSGTDWIIDGTKTWITNGSIADIAIVWARTDDGIRGFAVPTSTPGFTVHTIGSKMSLRASVTSELVIDSVRVPDSARLPEAIGLGAPLQCLNEARFGIAFGAIGAARDCLETALNYARTRRQFGRPIGAFQLTQQKLADMTLEYVKGFLLAMHLGRRKDAGDLTANGVSLGKLNNVREALGIARTARTILGASGITSEYPIMRHAANLESVLTYEGTSEMHTLIIGQALTGAAAFR
jgi:glutaryl-CoA dehydrogenase